jgi:hypothetical protein
MMAEKTDDELPELSPDEFVGELRSSGIALTTQTLQSLIDAHRAEYKPDEIKRRGQSHSLLGLLPPHVDENVAYRAFQRGELIATRVGGRIYSSIANVEDWLSRTDRSGTKEDEAKWHATMARRFP